MNSDRTVAVAMSGGVDSSVTAALLVNQGWNVIGIMMRLWSHEKITNRCCSPKDMAAARRIAADLDIPFYVLDAQNTFKRQVVDFFVDGYNQGITPNPCIECNRHIRWEYMLDYARALGATKMATGHYARVLFKDGIYHLYRGIDPVKDQSYVLGMLRQDQLSYALFPLGELRKTEVREIARDYNLPVAEKIDSQDLCFVGELGYRKFLSEQAPGAASPGPIRTLEGEIIGEHAGLPSFTIGQRKGIGVSAPYPLYVVAKNVRDNSLVVGPKECLGRTKFETGQINWISGSPPGSHKTISVQVRYQARAVQASVKTNGGGATTRLTEPLPDITPGQLATFYAQEECLGAGIIQP
jgi:tRNA-specific 2-thiouridylase